MSEDNRENKTENNGNIQQNQNNLSMNQIQNNGFIPQYNPNLNLCTSQLVPNPLMNLQASGMIYSMNPMPNMSQYIPFQNNNLNNSSYINYQKIYAQMETEYNTKIANTKKIREELNKRKKKKNR